MGMRLTFIGADHEVTGSCHLLQACGRNILVDCGMEQGNDVYENQELPVNPSDIDYVLLTHAHIDHTGLLPLLYARGFRGQVYTTKATADLCNIMLRDSAHIQEFEAEWRNRKAKRSGEVPYQPLYEMEDAVGCLELFCPCAYSQKISLCEGITIRFTDVGHLLGSASIEIWAEEEGSTEKIVFSGDIGNRDQPIIKNPSYIKEADYVVMESTYGDRNHKETPDYVKSLAAIIKETFDRGGNVVIPSFAVGRTQEILYFIRKIKEDHMINGFGNFEVYVDSPLAIEATNIFQENTETCFDEDAMELIRQKINPLTFPGLKLAVTSDDSVNINFIEKPKVIISASGMCEAGRIRHHLKHNLWRPESTIVFVGYQAAGTLGRTLLDGTDSVRLFGDPVSVKAKIVQLDGISGHADKNGLLRWVTEFSPKPKAVFVVHGEDQVCGIFTEELKSEYGLNAYAPFSGACYDLQQERWIQESEPVLKPKKVLSKTRAASIYEKLITAGQRLVSVIARNKGGTNKDISKFTDQINALCDKWDRK